MASKPCPPRCACGKHKAGPKVAAALRGRTLASEHRVAISRGVSGYVPSASHRARLAESKRGARNPMRRPEVAAEAQRPKTKPLSSPETDLEREAAERVIHPPTSSTLRGYGLTREDWLGLLADQGWRCPVCLKSAGVRWNVDHDHVPRWSYRPPEQRKKYVRGVLCAYCNFRRVNSRMSALEARRIADYLAAYEARRNA